MAKYRLVKEEDFLNILEMYNKMIALENGGVDNWEWYGASLGDYLEEWIITSGVNPDGDWDFTSIAEEDLNNFASCEF